MKSSETRKGATLPKMRELNKFYLHQIPHINTHQNSYDYILVYWFLTVIRFLGGAATEVQVEYYFSWATGDSNNTKGKERNGGDCLIWVLFGCIENKSCGQKAGSGRYSEVEMEQKQTNWNSQKQSGRQTEGTAKEVRVNHQKGFHVNWQNLDVVPVETRTKPSHKGRSE